jgi:GTP-binding protein
LNEVVNEATLWMTPPMVKSRQGRVYYCLQVSTAPPTLVFFVNDPSLFTDNYKRYLERKVRESLKFDGTPVRMFFRGKSIRRIASDARKGDLSKTVKAILAGKEEEEVAATR